MAANGYTYGDRSVREYAYVYVPAMQVSEPENYFEGLYASHG